MATPVRLQRYLAAAGVAARRKAEDLITAGRVTVNGKIVTTLGTKVDPGRDEVMVDGEAVVPLDYFYVLFNKPKGCITAVTDDRGRMTVMDYLPNLPVPVKPVGRLDFYTEGVLLLTNDGELAARLLAPASHVPKTYHVKVHGQLRPDQVKRLRHGVQLDDGTTTMPAEVEQLPGESKHTWLAITIHEGKHRQIHRMIEALGHRVDKLQRVAFANLTFHHLRVGDARELSQQELNELRDLVELDHSAVARGKWRSKREQTDIPRRAHAKAIAEAEDAAALAAERRAGADDREDAWGWAGEGDEAAGWSEPGAHRGGADGGGEGDGDRESSRPTGRVASRGRKGGAARAGSARRDERGTGAQRGPTRGGVGRGGTRGGFVGRDERGATRGGFGGRDERSAQRGSSRGGFGGREERGASRGGFGGGDERGSQRGPSRGGFGGRDERSGSRGGFGGRDERGGSRGGFGGRDERGAQRGPSRGGFGSREERGGSRGGFGGRDARGAQRGSSRGGFGGRDERGAPRGPSGKPGPRGAGVKRGPAAAPGGAKSGTTRAGQGRSFGKRTGASGGRRGPRR